MGKSVIGVDIGTTWIRAVEVEPGRKGKPVVVRHHEVRTPEGAVKSGEVIEPNTVAAVLKKLWSTAGFRSKDVVLGMGNAKTLVRDLTVPRLGRKEIRAALPFQVQDMLPVPVADALLDFYPVSESVSENGPVVSGLLVAAVKDAVVANVTAVQLAGLNPVEVDLIPFAMNRVLTQGSHAEGTVALVDVGATTTNVLITKNGVPQFVRIIPAGGSDVTRALISGLGLSDEQAELGKRQLGLNAGALPAEYEEAANVIRELTHELLNSLRNTLSFYVNSRREQRIDRILLSGGGSDMSSFGDALSEITRIPVLHENPFSSVSVAKSAAADAAKATAPSMTVALGLALGRAA